MTAPRSSITSLGTDVPVSRTLGDIHSLLVQAGASSLNTQYKDGQPVAIIFCMDVALPGGPLKAPVHFALPARWEGALKRLPAKRSGYGKTPQQRRGEAVAQAHRIAWRNVFFWVKAQLSLIELEQAEIVEVFLPYAMTSDGSQTVWQQVKATKFAGLLPSHAGGKP